MEGNACILRDLRIPTNLKGKFYRTPMRRGMIYRTEYWAAKKHVNKMSTKIWMLRLLCGKIRWGRIRNGNIHDMVR